jgi:hypothetical protein
MKTFAYSVTKCCWAGIATGNYKKVMCAKAGLIHTIGLCGENIYFFGTKYTLDHKIPKIQTKLTSHHHIILQSMLWRISGLLPCINLKVASITIRTVCCNPQIYPPLDYLSWTACFSIYFPIPIHTYAHIQITQKSSPYTNKEGS